MAREVYVGMVGDLFHFGHVRLLAQAALLGEVVTVGLLTDDAVASYKRQPIMSYSERAEVLQAIRWVTRVVPQTTLDYRPNLRRYQPAVVLHGEDWCTGPQRHIRAQVIECLATWGGGVVEVPCTPGVCTTDIIERVRCEQK